MSSKKTILVVDDEPDLRELIEVNLKKDGYKVVTAGSGEEALTLASTELPALIVLDLMLPGVDGFEVCRRLKAQEMTSATPVIMLTALTEEPDVVAGLELGAVDYITKPFSPRILRARVKAAIRRQVEPEKPADGILKAHNVTIDKHRHEVRVDGEPVKLTSTEFRVLYFLASKPGWVFSRFQIVDSVKGEDYAVTERSVDVQIVALRKKLGDAGQYIETVRGVGYRFRE
jgi:two-component system phosphate regulon response regulator PhoB